LAEFKDFLEQKAAENKDLQALKQEVTTFAAKFPMA